MKEPAGTFRAPTGTVEAQKNPPEPFRAPAGTVEARWRLGRPILMGTAHLPSGNPFAGLAGICRLFPVQKHAQGEHAPGVREREDTIPRRVACEDTAHRTLTGIRTERERRVSPCIG